MGVVRWSYEEDTDKHRDKIQNWTTQTAWYVNSKVECIILSTGHSLKIGCDKQGQKLHQKLQTCTEYLC